MDNETGPPWEQLGPAGAFCIAVNNGGESAGEGAVAGINAGVLVERAAPIDADAGAFCGIGEDNTAGAPMEVAPTLMELQLQEAQVLGRFLLEEPLLKQWMLGRFMKLESTTMEKQTPQRMPFTLRLSYNCYPPGAEVFYCWRSQVLGRFTCKTSQSANARASSC